MGSETILSRIDCEYEYQRPVSVLQHLFYYLERIYRGRHCASAILNEGVVKDYIFEARRKSGGREAKQRQMERIKNERLNRFKFVSCSLGVMKGDG